MNIEIENVILVKDGTTIIKGVVKTEDFFRFDLNIKIGQIEVKTNYRPLPKTQEQLFKLLNQMQMLVAEEIIRGEEIYKEIDENERKHKGN